MPDVPMITLNNGATMPQLGFGVFQVPNDETQQAVTSAIDAGYRSIDTARIYGNEDAVGEAIAKSGVPREELFVTTKLWNADQGYDAALRAFDESLRRLGLDQLDLYLIHWPAPDKDRYVETWKALGALQADGRVRAIGVSNFQPVHLRRIIDETGMVPSVNQIELHPLLQQNELRALHLELGIATEAWSPLAKGDVLAHPIIAKLAEKHDRTTAQVILRWHLQLGNIVIPKSVTPERIRQNFAIFDFALDDGDLADLSTLDDGTRTGPNPDTFNGG